MNETADGEGGVRRRGSIHSDADKHTSERSPRTPLTIRQALGNIVGVGRSGEPTNIAEHKDEYIADAIEASWK